MSEAECFRCKKLLKANKFEILKYSGLYRKLGKFHCRSCNINFSQLLDVVTKEDYLKSKEEKEKKEQPKLIRETKQDQKETVKKSLLERLKNKLPFINKLGFG